MARPNRNGRRAILLLEDVLIERNILRVERRRLRDSENPFELREVDFCRYFRETKAISQYLCDVVEPDLRKSRSTGLSVQTEVLVTLRFLAEGVYQRGVGQDFFLSVSQPTVSNCLRRVTTAICTRLQRQWVKFPQNNQERDTISQRFRHIIRFPGVVGAIDCTHIAVVTPLIHDESYKNRKGFYSLNVQMISDDCMRILHISCYPGTVHDQFIWNFSQAKQKMRETHENGLGRYYLIGDSGYALEPWLMIPLPHAEDGTAEYRYTRAHCKARSVIEITFGVLKQRWRCRHKDRVLHYQPDVAGRIVLACAILHYVMIHHRMPLPEMEHQDGQYIGPVEDNLIQGERLGVARRYQRDIINRFFT